MSIYEYFLKRRRSQAGWNAVILTLQAAPCQLPLPSGAARARAGRVPCVTPGRVPRSLSPLGPADPVPTAASPAGASRGVCRAQRQAAEPRAMVLLDLHSAAASADLARLRRHWWLNKHRINGCNRDKQTPLHLACINGHADVVQFLVENKCKLNPCDKLDKSPLMKAVEYQHRDCAAILLEHGANHDHRGVNGNTALHFAVMVSSKSLVELLLEHGADIDAKNKWGYTPLTLAITENCEEMVKFLLQKGADVNAQDKVYRTPLTVATFSGNKKIIQLLLQYGAVFPESDKGLNPCQPFTKMVQDDVIANEKIGSSCYETTPVFPLETPALAESCDVPKEEAAEKKDKGPAADQNKVSACSVRVPPYRGDYKAEGAEKKEDKRTICNPETDPKGQRKVQASARHPAATSTRSYARSAAVERGKGVLPAASGEAEKEDSDSSWCSEHLSNLRDKAINPVQRPAGKCSRVGVRSLAEKRGKGVLQPTGGAAKKEDTDSPWDSETDPKDQRKVQASARHPAATSTRSYARSAAVERGKGVLPAASGEAEKEDSDSSWCSEPFSAIVEEVFAGRQRPPADRRGGSMRSAAAECSKGVLQPAGRSREDDNSWDSETDSEGEGKVSAAVQLPAANSNRLDVCSAAVERGKGISKRVWREVKKEDRVLQPAGGEAKQEYSDSPWDSETDSEGRRKASANVQLPAADQNRVGVSSAAVKCGKGNFRGSTWLPL
ncbi:ankyrin repeat and KH domain-containing protein mask-1-like [Motacilla alba alba]|uniref:ankyrin repeat and KH domain-containing protein mask-1-like n=1 Tax=Motacilla alba alba TaxID=1094192 RepID=UPI0018D5119E|nr:ankyrin repeat and KH domain-containing protein mask-1-like [Motacilla alba alba]